MISELTSSGPIGINGVQVDNSAWGFTTTDEQGRYSRGGLWGPDAVTALWLYKKEFRIDSENFCDACYRTLTLTGDTELDIRLERLPAPAGSNSFAVPSSF